MILEEEFNTKIVEELVQMWCFNEGREQTMLREFFKSIYTKLWTIRATLVQKMMLLNGWEIKYF